MNTHVYLVPTSLQEAQAHGKWGAAFGRLSSRRLAHMLTKYLTAATRALLVRINLLQAQLLLVSPALQARTVPYLAFLCAPRAQMGRPQVRVEQSRTQRAKLARLGVMLGQVLQAVSLAVPGLTSLSLVIPLASVVVRDTTVHSLG